MRRVDFSSLHQDRMKGECQALIACSNAPSASDRAGSSSFGMSPSLLPLFVSWFVSMIPLPRVLKSPGCEYPLGWALGGFNSDGSTRGEILARDVAVGQGANGSADVSSGVRIMCPCQVSGFGHLLACRAQVAPRSLGAWAVRVAARGEGVGAGWERSGRK